MTRMRIFEVTGGELVKSLTAQAADAGITDAAVVSLIGGVDRFTVSTMPADDSSRDIVSTYNIPAEMHGSGEIRDGQIHIHATFAVQGDRAIAGHLHEAHIGTWFARAYILDTDPHD